MRRALGTLVESCTCKDKTLACPILEALDDPEAPGPGDVVQLRFPSRGGNNAAR
jgi:hypothetical protein